MRVPLKSHMKLKADHISALKDAVGRYMAQGNDNSELVQALIPSLESSSSIDAAEVRDQNMNQTIMMI